MPVNNSALPCTSCSQSTIIARVGAARKNVLIQPARTEVSTMASAPRIQARRQAVSRVLSDTGFNSFNQFKSFKPLNTSDGNGDLRRCAVSLLILPPHAFGRVAQVDLVAYFRLGQRRVEEFIPDTVVDDRLQAADRFQVH